jgi:hypothetical protein
VQALAVLVLSAVLGLCMLAIGPDVWLGGLHASRGALQQVSASVGLLTLAGGLAVMLTVCFEHAPAILVDRGGGLIAALMESARLVTESGTLRTWSTSVIAHGIQMAPLVIGFTLASVVASLASLPWWALALGPFAVLCLVVGQGMVVATYLALRDQVTDPRDVPAHASPSRLGTALWSGLLIATLAGPLCVAGALARPSKLALGELTSSKAELVITAPSSGTIERYIPDTALTVRVSAHAVRIVASDGGGVGKLSLPSAKVARVRVARIASALDGTLVHAIEVTLADGRVFLTSVDAAGVRLDDSATRRLAGLLPPSAYLVLALCLVWTATWFVRALPPQARLRRKLSVEARTQRVAYSPELARAFRRRWVVSAIWLVPAAFSSLGIGLWAALG